MSFEQRQLSPHGGAAGHHSTLLQRQLIDGLWLDARRALWFEQERTLVVADLHLGYAWALRRSGLLLPLSAPDSAVDRLVVLQQFYGARAIVLLGDVVHRVVALPAISTELRGLVERLGRKVALEFVAGNHDCELEPMLRSLDLPFPVHAQIQIGAHCLLHGDSALAADERSRPLGRLIIGHEHPAIRLSDGLTTVVKVPCFVVGPTMLILPAFSDWAAGTIIGKQPWMSTLARRERFTEAVAILGDRLLPIPLASRPPRQGPEPSAC